MMPLLSQMRNCEVPMIQTPDGAIPEDEIPLPPLPAAVDKDPDALMDTRYVCICTYKSRVSNGSAQCNIVWKLCLLKGNGLWGRSLSGLLF